jgi:hypothetical protein
LGFYLRLTQGVARGLALPWAIIFRAFSPLIFDSGQFVKSVAIGFQQTGDGTNRSDGTYDGTLLGGSLKKRKAESGKAETIISRRAVGHVAPGHRAALRAAGLTARR